MNLPFIIILIFSSLNLFSQFDQSGFITPNDSLLLQLPLEEIIYLPSDGISFYPSPQISKPIGKIKPGPFEQRQNKPPFFKERTSASIYRDNLKPQMLGFEHFFQTYDGCYHITFHEQKNGFVKIMESFEGEKWVSIDEIEQKGFKLVNWLEFYGKENMFVAVPGYTTVPILSSPYDDADVIAEIDKNHYDIRVIKYDENIDECCEGLYCKVLVVHYIKHPCFGGSYDESNIVDKYIGWLKFIDEKGKRLIIHHAGGC